MRFDKLLHFLGCYFICASLYILFGWIWVAVCVALIAGFLKEWIDSRDDRNRWSWGDVLADVLGIIVFVVQVYLN